MIRSLPAEAVLGALLEALESARIGCTVILRRGDALEHVYANAPLFGVDAESMLRVPPRAMLPEKELERLSAVFADGGAEDGWRRAVRTEIVRADGSAVPGADRQGVVAYVVTRTTSSIVVRPSLTRSRPTRRRLDTPRFLSSARYSRGLAFALIISRRSSSITTTSKMPVRPL